MGLSKATRPATAETVNRPRDGDRLGCAISSRATTFHPRFQAVLIGQRCIGHVLSRGRFGLEAFDADDNSIGTFPDVRTAALALAQGGAT
jgi:hypothetical protein